MIKAIKTKFTKGTWKVRDDGHGLIFVEVKKGLGMIIGRKNEQNIANAHLIAAAPEMYAAITLAKVTLDNLWKKTGSLGCKAEIESIDDVLSKARGEK